MNLYKFRSLNRLDYALDIILNERLFCSLYKDLNDPFEGLFSTTISVSHKDRLKYPSLFLHGSGKYTTYRDIDDLIIGKVEHTRICSLSSSLSDVRLWSNYADAHRGIAIEIDFSDITNEVIKVQYDSKLPNFSFSFLQPKISEVLTHKTKHWEYEDEYRIINNDEYYNVSKRIKAVYCGTRISRNHIDILGKAIPMDIPIYSTKINKDKIIVVSLKKIERDT